MKESTKKGGIMVTANCSWITRLCMRDILIRDSFMGKASLYILTYCLFDQGWLLQG